MAEHASTGPKVSNYRDRKPYREQVRAIIDRQRADEMLARPIIENGQPFELLPSNPRSTDGTGAYSALTIPYQSADLEARRTIRGPSPRR